MKSKFSFLEYINIFFIIYIHFLTVLGKWGYVCDDKFGLKDADVLCRELGFKMGAMEVRGSSYYPPTDANAPFNMDEVECKGNETSLRECDFKGWGVNNCGPDEVVGVVCKVQQLKCPDNYWLCSKSEECIPTAFLCDVTKDCTDGSDESPQVCNVSSERDSRLQLASKNGFNFRLPLNIV